MEFYFTSMKLHDDGSMYGGEWMSIVQLMPAYIT